MYISYQEVYKFQECPSQKIEIVRKGAPANKRNI